MLTANIIFAALLASSPSSQGDDVARVAASRLSKELGGSNSISIYYVSRTGEYAYSPEQIKSKSSVLIKRQCGGNCSRLMSPIVQHLQEATLSDCRTGQETVLVEVDGRSLVIYSNGGRAISYQGKCYYNKTNIKQRIKESEIIPP